MHVATRDPYESDQPDVGQHESDQHTRDQVGNSRNGRFSTRHRPFLTLRIAAVTSQQSEGEIKQVFPARKRKMTVARSR